MLVEGVQDGTISWRKTVPDADRGRLERLLDEALQVRGDVHVHDGRPVAEASRILLRFLAKGSESLVGPGGKGGRSLQLSAKAGRPMLSSGSLTFGQPVPVAMSQTRRAAISDGRGTMPAHTLGGKRGGRATRSSRPSHRVVAARRASRGGAGVNCQSQHLARLNDKGRPAEPSVRRVPKRCPGQSSLSVGAVHVPIGHPEGLAVVRQ